MTREEAMYLLNNLRSVAEGKEDEAIDMAIEALSADAVMRDATAEERESVQKYIDSISTEAVSVVRCKDCKYCWYDDYTESLECRHNKGLNEEIYGNDFCCYGERREE